MKRHVLIVDGDTEVREALAKQLELDGGFAARTVGSAQEALRLAESRHLDLVIIDDDLPDMGGREACRLMRKRGFKAPIIMLAAGAGDADVILGLGAGANDYVVRPVRFAVLMARIRAQLRQHERSDDAVFPIGPYLFKPSQNALIARSGRRVRLTNKETDILRHLCRADGQALDSRLILRKVWGDAAGATPHILQTQIYRLRQKIEENPAHPRLLLYENGGYRLALEHGASGDPRREALLPSDGQILRA